MDAWQSSVDDIFSDFRCLEDRLKQLEDRIANLKRAWQRDLPPLEARIQKRQAAVRGCEFELVNEQSFFQRWLDIPTNGDIARQEEARQARRCLDGLMSQRLTLLSGAQEAERPEEDAWLLKHGELQVHKQAAKRAARLMQRHKARFLDLHKQLESRRSAVRDAEHKLRTARCNEEHASDELERNACPCLIGLVTVSWVVIICFFQLDFWSKSYMHEKGLLPWVWLCFILAFFLTLPCIFTMRNERDLQAESQLRRRERTAADAECSWQTNLLHTIEESIRKITAEARQVRDDIVHENWEKMSSNRRRLIAQAVWRRGYLPESQLRQLSEEQDEEDAEEEERRRQEEEEEEEEEERRRQEEEEEERRRQEEEDDQWFQDQEEERRRQEEYDYEDYGDGSYY